MYTDIQRPQTQRQAFLTMSILMSAALAVLLLSGCSINPATGQSQFTALMSPQQEIKVGASEHQKIVQQFGLVDDRRLQAYVSEVGKKLAANTERPEVEYKFYVIDSPIVNAFALPGGYVYISRGLMALANSEAELAGVVGHEIGHITARHSAERYSTSVVTSLGASVLASVVNTPGVGQALGLGSNLYLSSYSRGQEHESDTLGIRYLARAGYDTRGMSRFLSSLQSESALSAQLAGRSANEAGYFSTHPATSGRVTKTINEAAEYPQSQPVLARDRYLSMIDGLLYGDSPAQGFVRGTEFIHTGLGFSFSVPDGFNITNQPAQVIATGAGGSAVIFDMVSAQGVNPVNYIRNVWMRENSNIQGLERITVNGLPAATASFPGQVQGRAVTIRVVAVAFNNQIARFQYAIPRGSSAALLEDIKRSSYSFKALSPAQKRSVKPYRVKLVTARAGDSAATMARRMPFERANEERFIVLNGLVPGESLIAGRQYKIISE